MVAPPGEWCCFILVIGLLSSVPPLARWRYCVPIQVCPLLIWWLSEGDRWKRYIPQQKSPRKDKSVGCPLGDEKSVGVAAHFPWPVCWAQIGYPKKRVFGKFEYGIWNNVSQAITWTRVRGKIGENRFKESGRSGAWFTSQKNNASATHFFALSPKPIVRFCWKCASLSLFRPQPHLPSFIKIHPSFQDLLAKTTFQIVTIIGDPILADNNALLFFITVTSCSLCMYCS